MGRRVRGSQEPYGATVRIGLDIVQAAEDMAIQRGMGAEGRARVIREALERGLEVLRTEGFTQVPVLFPGGRYRLFPRHDEQYITWWLRAPIEAYLAHVNGTGGPPISAGQLGDMAKERRHLDLDFADADLFFRWAATVDGWPAAGPKPVAVQRIA